MIAPNKIVRLEQSALGLAPAVLQHLGTPMDLIQLYERVSDRFEDVGQFILALDVLYVLGRIDIDFHTRIVSAN